LREDGSRAVGTWPVAWAGLLLVLTLAAGLDDLPLSVADQLAPGRLAANAGLLLLLAVAYVLPLAPGGVGRCAEDLAVTVVLALPVAAVAADWTPVDASRGAAYGALLASQAALAAAAAWAGAGRHRAAGTAYLVLVTGVLLGVPFVTYLVGETSILSPIPARFASSFWAARPLLLDRAGTLPEGFWIPALGVNLALAAGFAVAAALGRGRSG
jgi:hypothetical protein